MPTKMRQSLAQIEQQFIQEIELEQVRAQELQRDVAKRSRRRTVEREKKRSNLRFYLLALSLVLTAIIVTVVMFETLYLLLS